MATQKPRNPNDEVKNEVKRSRKRQQDAVVNNFNNTYSGQSSLFPEGAVDHVESSFNQIDALSHELLSTATNYGQLNKQHHLRNQQHKQLIGHIPDKENPMPTTPEEKEALKARLRKILDEQTIVYMDSEFNDYKGLYHTPETAMKHVGTDNPLDPAVQALVKTKAQDVKDFMQVAAIIKQPTGEVSDFDLWGQITGKLNDNAKMVHHSRFGQVTADMLSANPSAKSKNAGEPFLPQPALLKELSKKLPQTPFTVVGSRPETVDMYPIAKAMMENGIPAPAFEGFIDTSAVAKALDIHGMAKPKKKSKDNPFREERPTTALQPLSQALGIVSDNAHNALDDNQTAAKTLNRMMMHPDELLSLIKKEYNDVLTTGSKEDIARKIPIMEKAINYNTIRASMSKPAPTTLAGLDTPNKDEEDNIDNSVNDVVAHDMTPLRNYRAPQDTRYRRKLISQWFRISETEKAVRNDIIAMRAALKSGNSGVEERVKKALVWVSLMLPRAEKIVSGLEATDKLGVRNG